MPLKPSTGKRSRTAWTVTTLLAIVVGPPLLVIATLFLAWFPVVTLPTFSDMQSDVDEALQFGSLVLPADAHVLEVEIDRHRDERYNLKVMLSPTGVDELLQHNGLAAKPAKYPFDAHLLPAQARMRHATFSTSRTSCRPGLAIRST